VPFEVNYRGQQEVERRLAQVLEGQIPGVAQRAIREEAEIEMGEMKERTPVRTGVLRASGRVEELGPGEIGVRWAFGGAAITYAVRVHEDLFAFHRVGQAKYLESVLVESAPFLPERIARRMRQILGT
jgi:hypothetical protein